MWIIIIIQAPPNTSTSRHTHIHVFTVNILFWCIRSGAHMCARLVQRFVRLRFYVSIVAKQTGEQKGRKGTLNSFFFFVLKQNENKNKKKNGEKKAINPLLIPLIHYSHQAPRRCTAVIYIESNRAHTRIKLVSFAAIYLISQSE